MEVKKTVMLRRQSSMPQPTGTEHSRRRLPRTFLSGLCCGLILSWGTCQAQEASWSYIENYGDSLLYIHAIANYERHPLWQVSWENNLYRQNMIRLNYASVSQTELLSDARLVINEDLMEGLWFRFATNYYATLHRTEQEKSMSVGLEKSIYKNFSIFIYGNPQFEKEEIDIQYGLSLTNQDRTHYLRLSYVDVAPFWDDKNDQNSSNLKRPWQFVWEANWQWNKVRLFSRGRYDDGIERAFELDKDPEANTYQTKKTDDMVFKFYYYTTTDSFLEASYTYYAFRESQAFSESSRDFTYRNRIDLFNLGYFTPLGDKYRIRFGAHAVSQDAASAGFGEHQYEHMEFIPYIFAERFLGPGILEAGYMGSIQSWDYEGVFEIDDPQVDAYIDKLELAYTFDFNSKAHLKIAISHVIALSGFGGGNVQFVMDF